MEIKIPDAKSVIVFASYRTGSTALCDYYANNMLHVTNWDEAFHSALDFKTTKFKNCVNDGDGFVVKVMPDQFADHQKYITELAEKCWLVKIVRTDIAAQAASMYCCYQTNNWHLEKDMVLESYQIDMDTPSMDGTLKEIKASNDQLNLLPFVFDQIFDYQDLGHIQSKYKVMQKPTNYNDILQFMYNHSKKGDN